MEVHGIAKAMTESSGAHLGSRRICSARGSEKCRIIRAAARDRVKEMEKPECPFRMVRVRRNKAGDGSLDGSGAEGEEDPIDRKDHLIDPKSFRADGAGEKDPVEKTENAGEKSCGGEEKSSGDKRMSFMGRRHERLRSVRRIRLYICGKKRRI